MAINPHDLPTRSNSTVGIGQPSGSKAATDPNSQDVPLLTRELRKSDFRVLPEEARKKVLRELELAQSLSPDVPIVEEERQRVLQDRTLQYYCGGNAVACVRSSNSEGVAILAVGETEIGVLVRDLPPDKWKGVVVEFPEQV
ncbi:MAG TPA: hypothetical protein VG122_04455 [Gemmata sp.]|nr:hypothetical protein [Gemmata sp.]